MTPQILLMIPGFGHVEWGHTLIYPDLWTFGNTMIKHGLQGLSPPFSPCDAQFSHATSLPRCKASQLILQFQQDLGEGIVTSTLGLRTISRWVVTTATVNHWLIPMLTKCSERLSGRDEPPSRHCRTCTFFERLRSAPRAGQGGKKCSASIQRDWSNNYF